VPRPKTHDVNFAKLTKKQILWLANHRCKHGQTYLAHPACADPAEIGAHERWGYLDIETSNLAADFGIILTYCILDEDTGEVLQNVITERDIRKAAPGQEDRRLVRLLIEDIRKFDRIFTFYGQRFDIPYCRTRALINGLEFPEYGSVYHTDVYFTAKHKLRLSSTRLDTCCRAILGKTEKTRIDSAHWRAAVRGKKESIDYILDHNIKDVRDLQRFWKRLQDHAKLQNRSI